MRDKRRTMSQLRSQPGCRGLAYLKAQVSCAIATLAGILTDEMLGSKAQDSVPPACGIVRDLGSLSILALSATALSMQHVVLDSACPVVVFISVFAAVAVADNAAVVVVVLVAVVVAFALVVAVAVAVAVAFAVVAVAVAFAVVAVAAAVVVVVLVLVLVLVVAVVAAATAAVWLRFDYFCSWS